MAVRKFSSRLRSIWQKLSGSLLGVAALGLALGIGIGLGLWLDADSRPDTPSVGSATVQVPQAPIAVPQAMPGRPSQPRVEIAPWVSDPRRERPPAMDLPPEDLLRVAPPPLIDATPAPEPPPALAPLPAPQQDGALAPWRRYAVTPPATEGRPMVAVVIDDMGVDHRHSREAVALPAPLTLAYLPYARDIMQQTAAARGAGHELMVHVSMQPQARTSVTGQAESGGDPGPNALTVGLSPEEIRRRLDWALGQFTGYVGINNHMGSGFTANRPGMAVVIDELKRRGLLFLDSRTTAASLGDTLAAEAGVPHATRHVFLDNIQTSAEVRARLMELERIAKARGAAIAIGHPHETTLAVLRDWLPSLAGRGLALVPLSAIVAQGEARRNSAAARAEALDATAR
jgi:polysaccharide deacetylase 2 family uncharacterized protein YibQ